MSRSALSRPGRIKAERRNDSELEQVKSWARSGFRGVSPASDACPLCDTPLPPLLKAIPFIVCVWLLHGAIHAWRRLDDWRRMRRYGIVDPPQLISTLDTRAVQYFMKETWSLDSARRGIFTSAVTRLVGLAPVDRSAPEVVNPLLEYIQRRTLPDQAISYAVLNRLAISDSHIAQRALRILLKRRKLWWVNVGEVAKIDSEIQAAAKRALDTLDERLDPTRPAASLLRPAASSDHELLRPAGKSDSEGEILLRPSASND